MKNKFITNLRYSVFLLLLWGSNITAQQTVFSNARGTTVYWNQGFQSEMEFQTQDRKAQLKGERTIFTSADNNTVFFFPSIANATSGVIPAPTFDFEGTPIQWYVLNEDSTFRNVNLQYTSKNYNLLHRDWLVHSDGSIYQLFQTGVNEGSVLQKIDSRNGGLSWININNLTTLGQIETDLSLFERIDGNVEVTGYRLFSNTVPNLFPAGLGLRKVYNAQSGSVSEKFYSEYNDGGLTSRNTAGRFGRILPIIEDQKYLSIDQFITTDNQYTYLVRSMDAAGKEIDTLNRITRPQFIDVDKYIQCDAQKINNNLYVFGASQHAFFSDTASFYNELIWLDQDGQVVNRREYTKELNYASYFNVDVYNDRIILTANTMIDPAGGNFDPQASMVILDFEGNIIQARPQLEIDGDYLESIQLIPLEGQDSYLYIGRFRGEQGIVYLKEEAGEFAELGYLNPKADNLVLNPMRIASTPDGDIVTFMQVQVDTMVTDPQTMQSTQEQVGNWLFTFAIDGEDLGLTTTSTTVIEEEKTRVFPNPSQGQYVLSWPAPFTGRLEVTDIAGRVLRSIKVEDAVMTNLNITDMRGGVYLLNLIDNDQKQQSSHRLVKF